MKNAARDSFAVAIVVILYLQISLDSSVFGGDWPQILGPQRNGHAVQESLADRWSPMGPKKRWEYDVGEGYAGPAVVNSRVVVFHRRDGQEVLECLSATEATPIWKRTWDASYAGGIDSDRGPRCVPVIHDGKIYAFGAGGDLHCVNLADGREQWSRRLGRDYKAQDGYFGFGSGPLVVGDMVLANVGGRNDASIVAVDAKTGQTKWTAFDDQASYACPISWEVDGRTVALFITRLHLVAVEPADGRIVFRIPFGARGPTVNAAAPLRLSGQRLFVTASYRIGAKCFVLSDLAQPRLSWQSDDVLSSQYPTPVNVGRFLYGIHGREDGPLAELRCVDASKGKVAWRKKGFGMAHLIVADGKLIALTTTGELFMLDASSSSYQELGKISVSQDTTRAMPAFSNGVLFVRSTDGKLAAWQIPK